MNKKIILSATSILVAMSLMAGATFAFFSSTASSTGNVFASGTLNLLLDDNNESTPVQSVTASIGGTNLAPGGTVSGFISMHNSGSIEIAKVKLGAIEAVTSSPDLATKLDITSATIGDDQNCSTNPHPVTGLTTLAALNGTTISMNNSSIAAGGTKYLCMTLTLDQSTDNTFQNKSITETFNFEGDQDLSQ